MKRNLLYLFTLLMLSTRLLAQDERSFIGYYRASGPAHLLLEEDHSFYIIAYATFIQGHWKMENKQIKLAPKNPEHPFSLYARYNPNIKEGYRIMFKGFEKKQTFITTEGTDTMQRIFNPNPNCFSRPYINQFPGKAAGISFVDAPGPEYMERKTYTFTAGKYNDFIAVYHNPSDYHHEIILPIEQKAGRLILKDAEKATMDEKLRREITEIKELAMKEQNVTELYCNPSYRPFDKLSMNFEDNYSFDSAKNAWVSKFNYEKDEEIYPEKKEDAYHSIGILYKYEKITPTNILFKPYKIYEKSVFTAKCSDQE